MSNPVVFVYAKDEKIKVLSLEDAKRTEIDLQIEGWSHVHTIDPCVYIQHLHNDCEPEDLVEAMIELRQHVTINPIF